MDRQIQGQPATTPIESPIAEDEAKVRAITGRTGQAIEMMVWQGMKRDEAAILCGLNPKTLANAFRMPRVKAYYASLLEALRNSERARNIHRLVAIRDAADNMPAVNAIKALEMMEDVERSSGIMQRTPGLQIVIVQRAAGSQPGPVIEHNQEPFDEG